MYEEYNMVGDLQVPTGNKLSPTAYFQKLEKEQREQDYANRGKSTSVTAGGSKTINDYLKPITDNPFVSKIFGEGAVDFQISGSAMIKFGANINVNRNPSFSKRQQKYVVPIFDQELQISANGNVGQYVKMGINYSTEAAFDFDNQTNIGWNGAKMGSILKDVQIGNVSLNLPTQLIKSTPNLFGFSGKFQMGKTTFQPVFSQNKGQTTETVLQGGQQLTEFRITADNYDQNRHYFLSNFFEENFNKWLERRPNIGSGVKINRVEVWVTNLNGNVRTPRDIVMFQDLGEGKPYRNILGGTSGPSSNAANTLHATLASDKELTRKSRAIDKLGAVYPSFEQSVDFDILLNARQLEETEYTLNDQLGFISLNSPLNNDEMLAVAFEFTYNGQYYKVGEFSRDVPPSDQMIIAKMIKGNTIRTKMPIWKLMMKNIYSLNTFGTVSLEDFKLDVIYQDDTSADFAYIPTNGTGTVFDKAKPLIQILGWDQLNRQLEAKPDNIFDAIEGQTINTQYGRVMFPVTEPFGRFMREKFGARSDLANYYCYQSLYDSTKFLATQDVQHNKFLLLGKFKSANGAEIFLGTTNLQSGSVKVTSNGRPLVEGTDFIVDYAGGRVTIINKGLLQSGAEIRASASGQNMFNIQQKTLLGMRMERKFNKNAMLGGTIMHHYERPLTTKTNFNEEPLLNTIVGMDFTFNGKSRFITKMVDKLPFIETKEISNYTGYFEAAQLFAHNHRSQNKQRGISNIEDFENAELITDYKNWTNWSYAAVPQKQPDLFPETLLTGTQDKFTWLNHNAALSFYTVDPGFYQDGVMPKNISKNANTILSDHYQRQIFQKEIFPYKNFVQGTPNILPTLDLVFKPSIKGQYNFNANPTDVNANGDLINLQKSWGGISRRVDQNDFEAANIDYIEMWVMDPFLRNPNLNGQFYLNLGSISEDYLPDRQMAYENGNSDDTASFDTTVYGKSPRLAPVNFAFSNDPNSLSKQDVGLDGLSDVEERNRFKKNYLNRLQTNFGSSSKAFTDADADPSRDNFTHYFNEKYETDNADIIKRYSDFNRMQNSSSTSKLTGQYSDMPNSSGTTPNAEDVNHDFTMNQSENYFQYKINVSKNDFVVGKNYVSSTVTQEVELKNGQKSNITWYQLKIPIRQYQKAIGNISDFKSIRFMRMFMHGFNDEAIFRIGYINMVRADWRRYNFSLNKPGVIVPIDPADNTKFVVSTVNVEENSSRYPIAYVTPPNVIRVQNQSSLGQVLENEQALSLAVCGLKPGDAKGAFKTMQMDIRNYKNLQLYLHAEESNGGNIADNAVSAFIRMGTDLTNNYYEYEIPLKFTRGIVGSKSPGADKSVWPDENFIDLELQKLYDLKIDRENQSWPVTSTFTKFIEKGRLSVIGLPDMSNVKVFMIGIRNRSDAPICMEVWSNELRVKGINNKAGWAALGNFQTNLADFGTFSMAGTIRTIGFGDVDKKLNERNLSTNMNFDIASSLNLGQFFGKKANVSLPMYIGYSETYQRPKYFPLNPDLELANYLKQISDPVKRKDIRKNAEDYNSLYSFNFNNIQFGGKEGAKNYPWALKNFTASYSYQNNYRRNQQIEEYFAKTRQAQINYAYAFQGKSIKPFAKIFKKNWMALLRDFNFKPMPTSFSTSFSVNRYYSENQARNNNKFKQINPRFYDKNFFTKRTYNLGWDLTENLNISYNATMSSRVEEPFGALNTEAKKDTVKNNLLGFGKPTNFNQNINVNYTLPVSKIPLLSWIRSSLTYTGSYEWLQAPPAIQSLGNSIQNARTINLNNTFTFTELYNKIPWLRDLEGVKKPKNNRKNIKPADKKEEPKYESARDKKTDDEKQNPLKLFAGRFISMFKMATLNYTRNDGTMLPGFMKKPDYFGQNFNSKMPGIPFVFGWQENNIRYRLAQSGAISNDILLTNNYRSRTEQGITGNITLEPIKDFRIQLDFSRNSATTTSTLFRYDGTKFTDQGLTENGTFSITGIFFKTMFVKDIKVGNDDYPNQAFTDFLGNRFTVAQRLSNDDPRVQFKGTSNKTNYPFGYSKDQQDVLLNTFYASYTGKKNVYRAGNTAKPILPLPSWNINYNGLMKLKLFKKYFSNFNVKHAYSGKYTLGNFTQNGEYKSNQVIVSDEDIKPRYNVPDATITDQFSPLVGISFSTVNNWTVNFDYSKTRMLQLQPSAFKLLETRSNTLNATIGYRVTGLLLPIKRQGRKIYLPNDFRFDMNVAINDNVVTQRRIDQNSNKRVSGINNIRVGPAITYQVNQKINMAFRFNKNVLKPKLSNQYYTALTDFGLEFRYILQ